jgi:hypothetical protein
MPFCRENKSCKLAQLGCQALSALDHAGHAMAP